MPRLFIIDEDGDLNTELKMYCQGSLCDVGSGAYYSNIARAILGQELRTYEGS